MIPRIILIFILTLSNIWLASAFEASYYADTFEGGTSSNGTTFSQTQHTAAICYEELSQLAYISTAQTGMVVTLTDRPNCSRHSDRIDLSSSAFSMFAPLSKWLIRDISAVPLGVKTGKFIKRDLSRKEFSSLWVELKNTLSNMYFAGDTIIIEWRVLDGQTQAILFLVWKDTGKQIIDAAWTDEKWNFTFVLNLPTTPEEYEFVIASGRSISTERAVDLRTIDRDIIVYPEIPTVRYKFDPIYSTSRDATGIRLPQNIWGQLNLSQWNKRYTAQWSFLSFSGITFVPGRAQLSIDGYALSTPSSLDRSSHIARIFSGSVMLDRVRESTELSSVNIRKVWKTAHFRFRINRWFLVQPDYYVALPNWDVREYSIHKKFIDSNGYIKVNTVVTGSFPIPDTWTYRFEVNQSSWIAYINVPFYTEFTLPIIEQKFTLPEWRTYEMTILDAMNTIRRSLWRKTLLIDSDLSKVATLKAKDMYTTKASSSLGVSHTNSKWNDIRSFAGFYGVTRDIFGENVAWSNNTTHTAILELHDGLEESPGHRNNIISPDFTKVGIWYYQKGGYSYLVHIFSN